MNHYKKLFFRTFISFLISFSSFQVNAQSERDLIDEFLKTNQVEKKLQPADINDWVISDRIRIKNPNSLIYIYSNGIIILLFLMQSVVLL
jgi:hypothetical protein